MNINQANFLAWFFYLFVRTIPYIKRKKWVEIGGILICSDDSG